MAVYRPHRTKHDHSAFDFSGVGRGFYWVLYKFSNRSVFFSERAQEMQEHNTQSNRLFWFVVDHIYANLSEQKKGFAQEKSSTPRGLVRNTKVAADSLFWDTNMAAVTLCENTP